MGRVHRESFRDYKGPILEPVKTWARVTWSLTSVVSKQHNLLFTKGLGGHSGS